MQRSQKELNRLALQLHFAAIARAPKKPDDVIGAIVRNVLCLGTVLTVMYLMVRP